ncbi:MAG TPA: hypothetical protein VFR96_05175 [Povalibacter sp.]|nr:hypothetical protein [Povalibacter sp.]
MNDGNDPTGFERRSKAVFEASVDGLSGDIRSRLARARHRAVAEVRSTRAPMARRFWMPAAGLGAAALAAILFALPMSHRERALPAPVASAEDMAMLLNSEDLDMIENMDFYSWMDSEAAMEVSGDVRS